MRPYTQKSDEGVRFLTQDHLGSTRVVTDAATAVRVQSDIVKVLRARSDFMPFGEEIAGLMANRVGVAGYSKIDGTRQKFTGKERDAESGLDYFIARYYSSIHGRFTSADPLMASGRANAPQTWNRYNYALNNPLKYVNPLVLTPALDANAVFGEPPPDDVIQDEERLARQRQQRTTITNTDQMREQFGQSLSERFDALSSTESPSA